MKDILKSKMKGLQNRFVVENGKQTKVKGETEWEILGGR